MKRFISMIIILAAIQAIAQETPYAGISYFATVADKVTTEDNAILSDLKSTFTNFGIYGLYGDSLNDNWLVYGELRYNRFKTSTNISEADKASLKGIVPELVYSSYSQNMYELSLGGTRNFSKNISVILHNSIVFNNFNYSNTDVKAYEYLFLGYSNFKIKKYFNLGIGGFYYTNFYSNTVFPIVAFGLNFKKLSIDANLPLNIGIVYKLTEKLRITSNGNLSFGTMKIPDNNPDFTLAQEVEMLDIKMTLGLEYKIKKIILFTNLGFSYMEKTYKGTSNLKMNYPESLYLNVGLSLF